MLPFSSTIHPEFNFSSLSLSLEDFERRGNFRNGVECGGDVSIVRPRRFAISTNPKKNREESREKRREGEDEAKLIEK